MKYKDYVKESYSHLNNKTLLEQIDTQPLSESFVRIILLNSADEILQSSYQEEETIATVTEHMETIEGEVTQGNLSVNGKSSIRRTGSLTLVATEENYKIMNPQNKVSIKMRFALEKGVRNMFDDMIYYFPLGVFCATNASIQRSLSGYTISLSFKDKMVLLNGELGGSFPCGVDLHQETLVDGSLKKVAITTIIVKMIQTYSDVVLSGIKELTAAELEEYGMYINGAAASSNATSCWTADNIDFDYVTDTAISWIGSGYLYKLTGVKDGQAQIEFYMDAAAANEAQAAWEAGGDFTSISLNAYSYGSPVGYQRTLFVFPGELSANAGENIASILEKIRTTVATNHEFYFDVLGDFHFEKIKHNLFGEKDDEGEVIEYPVVYEFAQDSVLISAYNNAPNYAAIKNDFCIWGEQTLSSGVKRGIFYHLVYETPPTLRNVGVSVCAYKNTDADTGYKWRLSTEEGSFIVIPQHYMEELYLRALEKSGNSPYYAELHSFLGNLVDLNANDATRLAQWQALEQGGRKEVSYWLELINLLDENDNYQIQNLDTSIIGRRNLSKSETSINCLTIPQVENIYISTGDTVPEDPSIVVVQVKENLKKALILGRVNYSAEEYLRGLLHNHISYCETISVTSLPIYHLEPNCCIEVNDEETSISGKYILNSYSIPLDISGMMSLSCSRALEMLTVEEEEIQ